MSKTGLDDYLLTHSVEEFLQLPEMSIEEAFSPEEIEKFEAIRQNQKDAQSVPSIGAIRCTDMGNGERLALREKGNLAWTHDVGWRYWDGSRWKVDIENKEVGRRASACIRKIGIEAARERDEDRRKALFSWAIKSESTPRKKAMITEAEDIFSKDFPIEIWDKNHSLLNLNNGTLNMDTGEFYQHRPDDHITKIANVIYDPSAKCPLWSEQLNKFVPNLEDQQFLQRASGYSLSGNISSHCFFILYGEGGNGKSTFIDTIFDLMGDYAGKIGVDTIIEQQTLSTAVESDLASLHGLRLVLASEPNARKKLNTSVMKQMTSEIMRGKWYHQGRFSFKTTHKLWIETNHKLNIPDDDDGTWRRLKQLPWIVKIPDSEIIRDFHEKLKTEYSGILNWMIDGYKKWQIFNIGESPNTKIEKEKYRHEEDKIYQFLQELYTITGNDEDREPKKQVYENYSDWCKHNGARPLSSISLYRRLLKKGNIGEGGSGGTAFFTKITKTIN